MTIQVKVGDVTVTAMADFVPPAFPTSQFFPDVPEDSWKSYRRWLTPQGQFQTNFCFFALKTPSGIVLVDTGLGPGPHEMMGGGRGKLLEQFQIKGFFFGSSDGGDHYPPAFRSYGVERNNGGW
jgi:glyoxylase-like metal-dependent hydrolase (beta-lactamase superfamily II)